MTYTGIDYGRGTTNVDTETGIRFGVISQNSINLDWTNDFENDYGTAHCPECGNDAVDASSDTLPDDAEEWENTSKWGCNDYACIECRHYLDSSNVFSDEAIGWSYDGEGYKLCDCLDNDIFVLASPYYTFAQFCSPCVPGAGNLDNPTADGVKTYCLGHDWFDSNVAPYPVYSVQTGIRYYSEDKN